MSNKREPNIKVVCDAGFVREGRNGMVFVKGSNWVGNDKPKSIYNFIFMNGLGDYDASMLKDKVITVVGGDGGCEVSEYQKKDGTPVKEIIHTIWADHIADTKDNPFKKARSGGSSYDGGGF